MTVFYTLDTFYANEKKRRDEIVKNIKITQNIKITLKKRLQELKYRYSHTHTLLKITEPIQYLLYDRYGENLDSCVTCDC